MFQLSQSVLEEKGAAITTQEIKQQPELWGEVLQTMEEKKELIQNFLDQIRSKHDHVRVIFSGAGTSAFVGETLVPTLRDAQTDCFYEFSAFATTDIVASPTSYFKKEEPTILVSFARSGNSPESVATVELAEAIVDDLYQITITCAPEGALAKKAEGDSKNLLLLQPERSNDQGFAMTGSFSCMYATALFVFEERPFEEKVAHLQAAIQLAKDVFKKEDQIIGWVEKDIKRAIYLGQGPFFGLAHEAQLKILELTAGEIATLYETSLGFRHGPKSFVNDETCVIVFVSNDLHTKKYDHDILEEVAADAIARNIVAITTEKIDDNQIDSFVIPAAKDLPDAYLALPYIIVAQAYSLISSVYIGNTPDTPSKTGTVNRVVKGVTIHPFNH